MENHDFALSLQLNARICEWYSPGTLAHSRVSAVSTSASKNDCAIGSFVKQYHLRLVYAPKLEDKTQYSIRPLTPADQLFLWEMLYRSLYVPEGGTPFERAILEDPDIAKYVSDWGRTYDSGFVAIDKNARPIGAGLLRLLSGNEKGFGYVDDKTAELGMAVVSEYRGKGIGTSLLDRLIASVNGVFESVSLSVAVGNSALRLYEKFGFEVVAQLGNSITMKRRT